MSKHYSEIDKEQVNLMEQDEIKTSVDFVTLGMCIIDDIYQQSPPQLLFSNVLGGAGIYAAFGARVFRGKDIHGVSGCKSVGMIVHQGCDFPVDAKAELQSWNMSSVFVETPQRLTTRGKNTYSGEGVRDFEFLTPKMQVDHTMLSARFLTSKSYHLICTPTRCIELVKGIMARRKALINEYPQSSSHRFETPVIVWEPMEHCCRPSQLPSVLEAMDFVDVFSPNDRELSALFEEDQDEGSIAQQDLQNYCKTLLEQGFGSKPSAVVIRMGEDGCFVASHTRNLALPAYHTPLKNVKEEDRASWKNKVADPTGGGNAFLGGYCIGLLMDEWRDLGPGLTPFEGAALAGSVAASFAIEQSGMPKLTYTKGKEELWNSERSIDRLDVMRKRVEKLDVPVVSGELFDKFSPWEVSKTSAVDNTRSPSLVHGRNVIKDARTQVS